VESEVEGFLETQFEMLRQLAQARSGLDSALVYVAGALEAVVSLGLATETEIHEWSERVHDELGEWPGRSPPTMRSLHPTGGFGGSMSYLAKLGPGPVPATLEPVIPTFLRLIPASADELFLPDGRLRFIGIELYDVALVLQWRMEYHGPGPRHGAGDLLKQLQVTDDTGVTYRMIDFGGRGGRDHMIGQWGGWPGLPKKARELQIELDGSVVRIPVR
jgi:hypothetical protein